MSEFGHTGIIGDGWCIDAWGTGPFFIESAGKTFRFEDSDRFGPALVKRNGDIAATPERSPFWRAHRIWVRQGQRLKEDGSTCIWDEPKATTYYRINSRNGVIVECGEEDGRYVEVPPPAQGTEAREGEGAQTPKSVPSVDLTQARSASTS